MRTRFVWSTTLVGIALGVFAGLSLWPSPAQATVHNYNIVMGEAEALSTCNPNPAPAGSGGSGTVTYDDVTNSLSWNLTFSNLSGPAVAAHFHGPATPAQDAGIQVTISDLTSPSVGNATLSAAQETDLLAGLYYINYHTSMCSGGEIRGQVIAGVGGTTGLTDPASAPRSGTPVSSDDGMPTMLYVVAAGVTLFCVGGGVVAAQRLRR
jgi:hypothetical protein